MLRLGDHVFVVVFVSKYIVRMYVGSQEVKCAAFPLFLRVIGFGLQAGALGDLGGRHGVCLCFPLYSAKLGYYLWLA